MFNNIYSNLKYLYTDRYNKYIVVFAPYFILSNTTRNEKMAHR